jgi:hypothetical protein
MKHTWLLVTAAVIVMLAAGIFLPAVFIKPKPATDLPWQVEPTAHGGVEVFGLTVGESTLQAAQQKFGDDAKVMLFRSPKGAITVEGYFDKVSLHGLDAKMVVGLRIPEAELAAMYERGTERIKLATGSEQVTLAPFDRGSVNDATIGILTYMPSVNLNAALVARRFGEPAEKWKERGTGVVHWLYPRVGLDVAMSESEKEVLQYVPPAEFARLREPLTAGERLP